MNNSINDILAEALKRLAIVLSLLFLFGHHSFLAVAHANGTQDPKVRRLIFTVKTGEDDLRGGDDNLNVIVNFRSASQQMLPNVNKAQSWGNNTSHTFDITLRLPVTIDEIVSIEFRTTFKGGSGGDNWNMDSVSVRAMGDGIDKIVARYGFMRFTGENKSLSIPITITEPAEPGQASKLELTIVTGGDDLRGNTNNLDVTIGFITGYSQTATNINESRNWANGSTHTATILLDHPVDPSNIVVIDLNPQLWQRTGLVQDVDNWDMASISVRAIGNGVDKIIARHGFFRFKNDKDSLRILITRPESGKAGKLGLIIKTGGDDLRGDDDNLNVTIHFRGGGTYLAQNVNGGKAWQNGSLHNPVITLPSPVDPSDIVRVDLQTTFTGGMSGDNWDMESVFIEAVGEGVDKILAKRGYFRFTGSQRLLSIPITQVEAGKASKLELTFKTGGDDLRGDKDDLNIILFFRAGGRQVVNNINGGKAWANNSTHVETITLNGPVDPANIIEMDLRTTFGGGTGGDNWDMESITVRAVGDGVNDVIFKHGPKRFTHDDGFLTLKRQQ
jgi:hypothetical protein